METFVPSHFEAEGTVNTVKGTVSYQVISEDYVMYDEAGNPEASIFSYSYFRTDTEEKNRPIMFAFNGGPGSACVWIHTGVFGPLKMKYEDAVHPPVNPPYEMEENKHWILDTTDLVLIDPVGTGYGRLLQPEKAGKYYNTVGDASSIADFIENWLRKYDRRNSSVYLCGESYGTVRAPLVMQELMSGPTGAVGKMRGIPVKGILFMGTTLEIGVKKPLPVSREPMDLYTQACVAWYHAPEGKKSRREHAEEAWQFGITEYMTALYLKNSMTQEQKTALAEKLSYFTNIDPEYYLEHDFRISLEEFACEVGRKQGFDVGLYDGRYTMPHRRHNMSETLMDPVVDDPAMGAYTPSMTGAMETILKKKLNISFDREYRSIQFRDVNMAWQYVYRVEPRDCLELGYRRNPEFRLFMAAGAYDLVTTPGYARALVNQLDMPQEHVVLREYESGHMPYLGEESLAVLTEDIRRFISDVQKVE